MADHMSRMVGGRVVSVPHEVADEFSGVWTRSTCGLEDERNGVDVRVSVKFALFCSLGHESWFVLAAETRDGLQEKGATMETSRCVTEPLRLETRSMRAHVPR